MSSKTSTSSAADTVINTNFVMTVNNRTTTVHVTCPPSENSNQNNMVPYPTFEGFSRKVLTLTMIFKDNHILLGMKNRGMGKGKWNGFGGKVEPDETIDEGAKREVKEECGLDVISMDKIGIIEFEYAGSNELLEGHIYVCKNFTGDIVESDEMSPLKWFKIEDTPYRSMWTDHKFWYPMILKQIPFKAYFKYLNDDTLLDHNIKLLNSSGKIKQPWVNIVIKKDTQILFSKNDTKWNYLSKFHGEVKRKENVKDAAIRCLKKHNLTVQQIHQVAIVEIELLDEPHITKINVFVVDVSEITNFPFIEDTQWLDIHDIPANSLWPDNTFLSTLVKMKPFKAYFLFDEDNILFNKYYNN